MQKAYDSQSGEVFKEGAAEVESRGVKKHILYIDRREMKKLEEEEFLVFQKRQQKKFKFKSSRLSRRLRPD